MIDILVLFACAIAAILGWRRGALRTLLPVIGLMAGYGAAAAFYRPIGGSIASATGVSTLIAYPAGAVAVLLTVMVAFRLLRWWLARRQAAKRRAAAMAEDYELVRLSEGGGTGERATSAEPSTHPPSVGRGALSTASRTGGAALGAAWAFGIAMAIVWGAESLGALSGSTPDPHSRTGRVASRAFGGTARALVTRATGDEFTGSLIGAIVADPAGMAETVNELASNERVLRLAADPSVAAMLSEGKIDDLVRQADVRALLNDPAILRTARRLGVVEADATPSPEELAATLTTALAPLSTLAPSDLIAWIRDALKQPR